MKKFVKAVVATAMVFAMATTLVACSSSTTTTTETTTEETTETTTEETTTLVMATNAEFPPYEYHEGGEIVGIDAEIARAIATKLGYELEILDTAFDTIIPSVLSGKADFGMAGMTVTEERMQSVDFSDTYATGVQVVIVAEGSAITTVDDLTGDSNYTIGVQTGTTGDLYATWDIEDEGLGTVERFNKGADAVQALATGKVDCVIIDNEPAKQFVQSVSGLSILDTEYAVEDYAMCFAKDSAIKDAVNGALQELIADGTVQSIIDKYIVAE